MACPIVGGVATAFLVLNGAMLAYKTVTGIVNALETVKAAFRKMARNIREDYQNGG